MNKKMVHASGAGLLAALVLLSPSSVAQAPPAAVAPAAAPAPAPVAFAAANLTPLGVRSLAANCAACHGTNGHSAGGAIPGLAGASKEVVIAQLKAFKDGTRVATVMHQIVKGYSDAEMAALAEFFAAQKK